MADHRVGLFILRATRKHLLAQAGMMVKTWVLYGEVFPAGSVRFGAVRLTTAPHRRIFALLKTAPHRTAPHRTAGLTISENRTEPDRMT